MQRRLTLPGKPTQWQRPVKTLYSTFNPHQKQLNIARRLLKEQWNAEVIEGPVSISFLFTMPIAKSLSKKKQNSLVDRAHFKDPDIDNLEKFYLDALTGTAILDDCLVAELSARKVFGFRPGVEILLTPLEIDDIVNEQMGLLAQGSID